MEKRIDKIISCLPEKETGYKLLKRYQVSWSELYT